MATTKKTISKKKTSNSNLARRGSIRSAFPKSKAKLLSESNEFKFKSLSSLENKSPRDLNKIFVLVALLVLLAALVYKNKGLFVAGLINGRPIYRFQLDNKLMARYGASVLDEMMNDEMIKAEGDRVGIKVSKEEIDAKIAEIEKSLGGKQPFEEAMAAQGITLSDLKNDVSRRVLVEKLVAGSVNVSDQEVEDFVNSNRETLTATDEAGLKEEALLALTSQKKSAAIQKWFADLKTKAKINKYI